MVVNNGAYGGRIAEIADYLDIPHTILEYGETRMSCAQWECMEMNHGKWRFAFPTHTVRAFAQALQELEVEGGVEARYRRYCTNQKLLVSGMEALGFKCLLPEEVLLNFKWVNQGKYWAQSNEVPLPAAL